MPTNTVCNQNEDFKTMTLGFPSLVVVTLLLSLSVGEELTGSLQDCVPSDAFDPGRDYFPNNKYIPREYDFSRNIYTSIDNQYAPHNSTDLLTITYHNNYKIVSNKFVNKTYLLYQCGTEPPADQLDGRHHLVLPIPHQGGIVITETPQIPPIELLGLRTEIIGYFGNPIYVSSPCLNHMIEQGTIETVFEPDDPYNHTLQQQGAADFLARHPNAIIIGGPFGDKDGDRVLSMAASQERTNVATFDWISLIAALYNLEATSNKIAGDTQARYDCSSSNAALLSADRALEDRPVVLWAQYFQGYNWSVAECPTWDKTYYCEYAQHCGANILSRPEGVGWNDRSYGGDFWYLNDEELLELGKDADVWIYASQTWDTVYEQKKEVMDQFKAVKTKQVYDTQGSGPNGWYEQRLAEYDVVALDFCELVGNTNPVGPIHKRRWFRNIYTEPIGSFGTCNVPDEISEPYVPKSIECSLIGSEAGAGSSGSSRMTFAGAIMVALTAMCVCL